MIDTQKQTIHSSTMVIIDYLHLEDLESDSHWQDWVSGLVAMTS